MSEREILLAVRDLRVQFSSEDGPITALDGVNFDIPRGRTVGLVGESGCGKTVAAHAIMRLLHTPPASASGRVRLDGSDLLTLSERAMRDVRGKRIGMVFQDPNAALNPVYSVGQQVAEAHQIHTRLSRRKAREAAIELLRRVGLPEPEERYDAYPHELSGGMRQRVMIAIALSGSPELLIADEPTTALDMLAAAQISSLLAELQRERAMSLLLISHDIASVAENADEIVVLYAGQVVESGSAQTVLQSPCHPYTQALLRSVPPLRKRQRRRRPTPTRLLALSGALPDPHELPRGCRFAPRCPEAIEACSEEPVELSQVATQFVRCIRAEELAPEQHIPLKRLARKQEAEA